MYNTRLLIPNSVVPQSVAKPERRSSLAEGCTLLSINPSSRPDLRIKIHLVIHLDFHSHIWYLRAAPKITWFERSIWRTQCRILNDNTVQRRLSEPQLSETLRAKKNVTVQFAICNYGLLYWNITKPVKAVKEFMNLSKFTCVCFCYFYINVWVYSVIQKDGLKFVRIYFLSYTWYVN
jgi:hypothetical protein